MHCVRKAMCYDIDQAEIITLFFRTRSLFLLPKSIFYLQVQLRNSLNHDYLMKLQDIESLVLLQNRYSL